MFGYIISPQAKTGIVMNIIGILCITLSINSWGRAMFHLDSFPAWANVTAVWKAMVEKTQGKAHKSAALVLSLAPGTWGERGGTKRIWLIGRSRVCLVCCSVTQSSLCSQSIG